MRSKNVCIHFVIRKNVCVYARVFIQLLFRNISKTQRSIQMESDYRVINKSLMATDGHSLYKPQPAYNLAPIILIIIIDKFECRRKWHRQSFSSLTELDRLFGCTWVARWQHDLRNKTTNFMNEECESISVVALLPSNYSHISCYTLFTVLIYVGIADLLQWEHLFSFRLSDMWKETEREWFAFRAPISIVL